jgi:hypothetical protein
VEMAEELNLDEEIEKIQQKKEQQSEMSKSLVLSEKISNSVSQYYEQSLADRQDKIKGLTEKVVDAEIKLKEKQIDGEKKVLESNINKKVTKAKAEEDAEKHERSKTILKAQGLTEKLPSVFRITALVIGYPFFLAFLLTFGWVIEFITFVVKGFITMVYDCAERFVELNKKFTDNENKQEFNLGKAIFNILKWILVLAVIVILIIFLTQK